MNRRSAPWLIAALSVLPAQARAADAAPAPILAPAWASEPSAQVIAAARPSQLGPEAAAYAVLSCQVAQDRGLADCESLREWPPQFGVATAALSLTGQYRSAKPVGSRLLFPILFDPGRPLLDHSASGDAGLLQRLQLALTRPPREGPSLTLLRCQVEDSGAVRSCQTEYATEIDPSLAAYQLAVARTDRYQPAAGPSAIGYVTVFRLATENTDRAVPERVNAPLPDSFYPSTARDRTTGRVKLSCTVVPVGLARDCKVVSESPMDQGFANAALEYAGRSTFLPRRIDGIESDAQIDLDIVVSPSQEDANPPTASAIGPP